MILVKNFMIMIGKLFKWIRFKNKFIERKIYLFKRKIKKTNIE